VHGDERVLDDLLGRLDVVDEQDREPDEQPVVRGVQLLNRDVRVPPALGDTARRLSGV